MNADDLRVPNIVFSDKQTATEQVYGFDGPERFLALHPNATVYYIENEEFVELEVKK